jgi:hypothetical protein
VNQWRLVHLASEESESVAACARDLNQWQIVHLAYVREVGIRSGLCEEGMNLLDHSAVRPCLNMYM